MKISLIRKGTEIKFCRLGSICFFDLFRLTTEGSLLKLAQILSIPKKTCSGLQKTMTVPYTYFSSMERLFGKEVPSLQDPVWHSMRDGEAHINEDEHSEICSEVAEIGWYEAFSRYLRKDCVLVLAAVLIMDELYQKEFGVQMLSCCFTSAGAVTGSHIDAVINKRAVQGFCQIRNASVAKLLLHSRVGGIVEARCRQSDLLVESEDGGIPESVVGLDLNQVGAKVI